MLCKTTRGDAFESLDQRGHWKHFKHIALPSRKVLRASEVEEFNQKWAKSQVKSQNFELESLKNSTKLLTELLDFRGS